MALNSSLRYTLLECGAPRRLAGRRKLGSMITCMWQGRHQECIKLLPAAWAHAVHKAQAAFNVERTLQALHRALVRLQTYGCEVPRVTLTLCCTAKRCHTTSKTARRLTSRHRNHWRIPIAVLSSAFEQDTCGASDASVLRQGVPCADAKAASRWLSELLRLSGTRIITAGRAGALRIAAHRHHTPLPQVPSRPSPWTDGQPELPAR